MSGADKTPPPSTGFSMSVLQEPFVRELIMENEMMLGEISCLRARHVEECRQRVHATESVARQRLAAQEAAWRVELCIAWVSCLQRELGDTAEELQAVRDDNAELQRVMMTVQEELGMQEPQSPLSLVEEITPARVITAASLGSKLQANYAAGSDSKSNVCSPRVSFGRARKRGRASDDGWLFSPSRLVVEERSASQQPL
ncbi:hypothetical protein DQ04_00901030 [Trypanosoma grayi]|uniref:hypothetical protein n=1 Tax=Trypanosoma grayi TaxID=71804 RepID=UPI0004F41C4E|nr:hypothetical protein DQ04_00901030 [Trypanosoma grayi]KEG13601.1 hypothetical protein DQ04_00901030 [Trypanosoma grayi]